MKALLIVTFLFGTVLTTFSLDKNELLLKAVANGDKETVEKLIKDGADVNYIKEAGPWMKMNPLIMAINKRQFDIAKILMKVRRTLIGKTGLRHQLLCMPPRQGTKS